MPVTQAVIAVPVGADGVTPVSASNPAPTPPSLDTANRSQVELFVSIDNSLKALLILLTNAYGLRDNPVDLIAAADKDLNVN